MIFVTVGTHEQSFNRLVKYMDEYKKNNIDEDIIIQTGFSTYIPQYCTWEKIFPYKDMLNYISEARIVITHGGPSSFILALQVGKIPIVVPRQKQFNEHVNNHQVEFALAVAKRQKNIIEVEDINKLEQTIKDYNEIVCSMTTGLKSNNEIFIKEFKNLVREIIEDKEQK